MHTDTSRAARSRPALRPGSSSLLAAALCLSAALSAHADFSGTDSLSKNRGNWQFATLGGNSALTFRNSRLEFLAPSPAALNTSAAIWLPNSGSTTKPWFAQVDVHLDKPAIPAGSFLELGLSLEASSPTSGVCAQMMTRYHIQDGADGTDFTFKTQDGIYDGIGTTLKNATLRLHYDPASKQVVASLTDGSYWLYSKPLDIASWKLKPGDVFYLSLMARNGGPSSSGLKLGSGPVHFKNFQCGPARPEIVVHQPAGTPIADSKNSRSFGSVTRGEQRGLVFYFRNEGTRPLQNIAVRIDGVHAKDFILSSAPSAKVIKPGDDARFTIAFRPKAAGTRKAKLHLLSNDADEASFDVDLTGRGKQP